MAKSSPTPGVAQFKIGSRTVTVLQDGGFEASFDLVTKLPKGEAEKVQAAHFRPSPPKITLNAILIEGAGSPILVDTGMGGARGSGMGHMFDGLAAIGVTPAEIGTVLLTHLHPDHVGGMTDEAGQARFPAAEVVVPQAEIDHWLDPAKLSQVPDAAKPYFQGAQAAMAPFKAKMRPVTSGEVAPGITAVPLPGHTPGHTGYRLDDGGASLLIWADIVHLPGIQFAKPESGVAFDVDGEQAIATRKKVMDMAATEKLLVSGMHLEFPAVGHVVRDGQGYRWVPELWMPFGG